MPGVFQMNNQQPTMFQRLSMLGKKIGGKLLASVFKSQYQNSRVDDAHVREKNIDAP